MIIILLFYHLHIVKILYKYLLYNIIVLTSQNLWIRH